LQGLSFEATGVDALLAAIGLSGGAFCGRSPSKQALSKNWSGRSWRAASQMLAGDERSEPDHVAKRLRGYLSSFHAANP